jgi:hypothetical protein
MVASRFVPGDFTDVLPGNNIEDDGVREALRIIRILGQHLLQGSFRLL